MNERIKELAKQHGVDITIDGMGYGEGNIEGLAELIVRECADLLETSLPYNPQQKMIKKHFGVE